MPGVSKDPAARYVGRAWPTMAVGGPLTDRKIQKYIEAGWYGNQARIRAIERKQAKKRRAEERRSRNNVLLNLYAE